LFETKKYGFLDKFGKVVIDDLKYAEDFKDGYANITVGEDVYPMNKEGNVFVSDGKYSAIVPHSTISKFDKIIFVNSCILANYGSLWDKYGYKDIVSSQGEIVSVSPYGIYETVEISQDGTYIMVKTFSSVDVLRLSFNGYFLIDCFGELKEMQKKYFWYRRVDNDVQFYVVDSLHNTKGVVDCYGNEVIPCVYENIEVDNDRHLIKCKSPENYSRPFSQDFFCEVSYNVFYDFSFNQIIPDTVTGNTILKDRYDATRIFSANGLAAVCKDGRWGFVNKYGELAIPCIYLQVDDFKDGYCKAESDEDGWITINNEGKKL
jgi:hypothetical protein